MVAGDGGFMLGGLTEFSTAVRHGVDVVVFVMNDGAYGAEYIQFRNKDMDPAISTFNWPDLGPVATALGGQGFTVRNLAELAAAAGRDRDTRTGRCWSTSSSIPPCKPRTDRPRTDRPRTDRPRADRSPGQPGITRRLALLGYMQTHISEQRERRAMQFGIFSVSDITRDPVSGETPSEAERIDAIVQIAQKTEEVGLDVFAIGEHHNPPFFSSAPTTLLAYIAATTKKLIVTTAPR